MVRGELIKDKSKLGFALAKLFFQIKNKDLRIRMVSAAAAGNFDHDEILIPHAIAHYELDWPERPWAYEIIEEGDNYIIVDECGDKVKYEWNVDCVISTRL